MMNNLGKLTTIIFVALFTHPALAKVSAYLNQNSVYEGDSITLKIESNMNTDARPDLSILNDDFQVLGKKTNSQINIFNGQRSFKRTWTIELQAKKKEITQIPAITIGNERTEPLSIKISPLPPEVTAEAKKHVFIETTVGLKSNETYVQQQIPYTVKLYFDSAMKSGQLSQPDIENAVVEEITRDKRYTVIRDGKRFNVIEKHFTISPEKSGTLHIPATIVEGRIALSGGDSAQLRKRMDETDMLNKFFSNFNNNPFFNDPLFKDSLNDSIFARRRQLGPSQPFSVESKTIDIKILPIPKAFSGKAWLPAEELNIRDSWTRSPPELKVGEPVTRTLVLRAKGLGGSQIPTIDVAKPDNVKIYPQQPTSKTHTDGITLIGRQYFDITYIPQKQGTINIPEIKVDWWNTQTKKQETYTLPAWHLNVAPGVLGSEPAEAEEAQNTAEQPDEAKISDPTTPPSMSSTTTDTSVWNWKLASLLGLLLLTFSGWFVWRKRFANSTGRVKKVAPINLNQLKQSAIQACERNDKQAAAQAVLKLAQALWQDDRVQNLGAVMAQLEQGADVIDDLNKSLYAPSASPWNGSQLKQLLGAGLQRKMNRKATSDEVLAPLYPE